jgi:hypothetical protein
VVECHLAKVDVEGSNPFSRSPHLPGRAGNLEAPFTDDTRAVGLPAGASSYVAIVNTAAALGGDDFAIEVVLRTTPGATLFQKRAAWTLRVGVDGARHRKGDFSTEIRWYRA